MITREDIKNLATEWAISEQVVEKNYVIGWVLWGIGQDPILSNKWIFKGGTCIKKCYMETYRFSEDLDFTVLQDGPLKPEEVKPLVDKMLERVHDESGINFSMQPSMFKQKDFPYYTEGRIYYQGPRKTPSPASIKFDLLSSEKVIQPPVIREIEHDYSDDLPKHTRIRCYSLHEIFAEKIRAMGERGFPRDLYDIVFLFREGCFRSDSKAISNLLAEKCKTKGVPIPNMERINKSAILEELKSEWGNMLAHQLPTLPPFDEFWNELPNLFGWLEGTYAPKPLPEVMKYQSGEAVWIPSPTTWSWGKGVALEPVRFAAINHLCIELGYNGSKRTIEPYSLRQSKDGNILLYAVKVATREPRAYRIDRIQSIEVTTSPFKPVYKIEFPPSGAISAPLIERERSTSSFTSRRANSSSGPVYIYECPVCSKRFRRKKFDPQLNKHKDRNGNDCFGRYGIYQGTE